MLEVGDRVHSCYFGDGTVLKQNVNGHFNVLFDNENTNLHSGETGIRRRNYIYKEDGSPLELSTVFGEVVKIYMPEQGYSNREVDRVRREVEAMEISKPAASRITSRDIVKSPLYQRFKTKKGGWVIFEPHAIISKIVTPKDLDIDWHLSADGVLTLECVRYEFAGGMAQ
jgi:hypothetical protein